MKILAYFLFALPCICFFSNLVVGFEPAGVVSRIIFLGQTADRDHPKKRALSRPGPHSVDSGKQETVLCISADVSVELGRAVHMNFNLKNVEELSEFIDGLVLPGEEGSGAKDSQTGATGRTLFVRSFNLCTSDMFIQLEAPPVLGKPKLLGSVLGIEAKTSLKSDLQGM